MFELIPTKSGEYVNHQTINIQKTSLEKFESPENNSAHKFPQKKYFERGKKISLEKSLMKKAQPSMFIFVWSFNT